MNEKNIRSAAKYAALLILLTFILYRFEAVNGLARNLLGILFPFIAGAGMALFINVLSNTITKVIFKTPLKAISNKVIWTVSILISFIVIILVVVVVLDQ